MELLFKEWLLEESTITQYLKDPKISINENVKLMSQAIKSLVNQSFQLRQDIKDSISKLFLFWLMKRKQDNFSATSPKLSNLEVQNNLQEVRESINHFRDFIVYQANNNLSEFKKKLNSLDYKSEDMAKDDERYHEELKQKEGGKPAEGELVPLAGMPAGYYWVSLNKGYCEKEGKAMGHCGNVGVREGDNIFSLRSQNGDAHLTFIVNDQKLGESKGRNNNKPSSRYHPQIMALLLGSWKGKPLIENIRGGGYQPENNFMVSDLSPENQKILLEKKPYIEDYFKQILFLAQSDKNQALNKLENYLSVNYPIRLDLDLQNQEIILNKGGNHFYDFVRFLRKFEAGNMYGMLPDPDVIEAFLEVFEYPAFFSDAQGLNDFRDHADKDNQKLLLDIAEIISEVDFDDELEVVKGDPEIMEILRNASVDGYRSGYEIKILDLFKRHLLGLHNLGEVRNGFRIYEEEESEKYYLAATIKALKEAEKRGEDFENSGGLENYLSMSRFDPYIKIGLKMDKDTYNSTLKDGLQEILGSLA